MCDKYLKSGPQTAPNRGMDLINVRAATSLRGIALQKTLVAWSGSYWLKRWKTRGGKMRPSNHRNNRGATRTRKL